MAHDTERLALNVLRRDKEALRRAATLFALPMYAPDGVKLVWGTSDAIWNALGDTSTDANWYTKRATLSAVHAATVLYWLGDDSPDHRDTWAFLDRRIDDVMQIEKVKAKARENKLVSQLMAGPLAFLGRFFARPRLVAALKLLQDKAARGPAKKHGNMPV